MGSAAVSICSAAIPEDGIPSGPDQAAHHNQDDSQNDLALEELDNSHDYQYGCDYPQNCCAHRSANTRCPFLPNQKCFPVEIRRRNPPSKSAVEIRCRSPPLHSHDRRFRRSAHQLWFSCSVRQLRSQRIGYGPNTARALRRRTACSRSGAIQHRKPSVPPNHRDRLPGRR